MPPMTRGLFLGRERVYNQSMRWLNRRLPWLKVAIFGVFLVVLTIWQVGGFSGEQKSGNSRADIINETAVANKEIEVEELDEFGDFGDAAEMNEDGVVAAVLGAAEQAMGVARLENLKGKKVVTLTFDDGPSAATTGRLLDILKKNKVKATFFTVGTKVKANPSLVKREVREGHLVGNHSWAHGNLSQFSKSNLVKDQKKVKKQIKKATGEKPTLMRPPYGAVSSTMRSTIDVPMILWDVDPYDWRDKNSATVRKRVVKAAHDGAVILMHDIHATTVDAVPGIIKDLKKKGYEFVTVEEMATLKGVKLKKGKLYYNFR